MQVHEKHEFSIMRKTKACSIDILPDEILAVILSSLSIEESIRTSVLSRRWRYLWRFAFGPNLVFEFEQKIGENGSSNWKEVTEFVKTVNQVMASHQGPSVDKLIIRICNPLDACLFTAHDYAMFALDSVHNHQDDFIDFSHNSYESILIQNARTSLINPICDWIRFAMQKEVRVFELKSFEVNVRPSPSCPNGRHFIHYDFPDLDKFLSISPKRSSSLVSLTSFRLVNINIKDEMMEYLLSNCQRLEHLCIKGARYLSNLNVVSPSLKSLIICCCEELKNLKISAGNLVSFEYRHNQVSSGLCLQNLPRLSELIIDSMYLISFMLNKTLHGIYYNQLEKLVLNLHSQGFDKSYVCYLTLPCLRRLKQLELVIDVIPGESLFFYVLWAMASPFLSTFHIQFHEKHSTSLPFPERTHYAKSIQEKLNSYRHEHLKLVTMTNFASHWNYIQFALDLLQISKSLDKLTIKTEKDSHRATIIKDYAKLLQANFSSVGAELVIQ